MHLRGHLCFNMRNHRREDRRDALKGATSTVMRSADKNIIAIYCFVRSRWTRSDEVRVCELNAVWVVSRSMAWDMQRERFTQLQDKVHRSLLAR
jgi:hypothetical protein